MKEFLLEATRNGYCKVFTVLVVILVVLTQTLIVYNIHERFVKQAVTTTKEPTYRNEEQNRQRLNDQRRFEQEVVRKHQDMVRKFPDHPEMIIDKLGRVIEVEENKTRSLTEEITKVRQVLGLDRNKTTAPPSTFQRFFGRRLQSLSENQYKKSVSKCPIQSPRLLGPLLVIEEFEDSEPGSAEFRSWYGDVEMGGKAKPKECTARQKVAIIIPFRDRQWHLRIFLHHMHPILQRQQLDYQIFVVEQAGKDDFNRAALMNVGYVEAGKRGAFTCFVFHDVDLLPEDDRNVYTCPATQPKHMAISTNKWKYRLPYLSYFGGVSALNKEQMEKINGFANSFYGWGGEDDDLMHRIVVNNYTLFRYPANIGRYAMLKHNSVKQNEDLSNMMEKSATSKLDNDGLSTLKYTKLNDREYPLYTWILAKLPPAPKPQPKSIWSQARNSVWDVFSLAGGGFAKQVSDKVIDYASRKSEEEEMKKNHVYR